MKNFSVFFAFLFLLISLTTSNAGVYGGFGEFGVNTRIVFMNGIPISQERIPEFDFYFRDVLNGFPAPNGNYNYWSDSGAVYYLDGSGFRPELLGYKFIDPTPFIISIMNDYASKSQ
ncbi:MAG: hypothetical protein R3F02_07545 [Thiolinea sp.]